MKTVLWGSGILAVVLIALQKWSMNISVFHSVIALAVSLPLMLVGTRVLGETNWAPVSAMANMVQALFAVVAPGSVAVNMVASGMSGTVAANGEHLMQDYKAGKIVGSNNRYLTWMQLIATPIGALTVAWVYPILRRTYGIGAEKFGADPSLTSPDTPGLSSPISVKWAGFAELLVQGLDALPKYSLHALAVAAVLGVVLTVLEPKYKQVLPSPTGLALGMLIPAIHIFPMVAGALVQYVWKRKSPQTEESLSTPLASGLIVGEALLALVIPLLTFFGILSVAQGGGH